MEKFITSKLISSRSDDYSSFKGPLFQFPVMISIDRNKSVLRRWICFSSGKRSTLVNYLFGKWLWDELTKKEQEIFLILPEITSDPAIYSCFRARVLGVPKNIIRKRLENLSKILSVKYISRQQYLSIKGRSKWFFKEETISLRKTTKYSGYTKHYKDKGSIGSQRRDVVSEILESYVSEDKFSQILQFISVGKFDNLEVSILFPDEGNNQKRKS